MRNLDKHAQSGGEKSVSTMLYLVALQVRSPSPQSLRAEHGRVVTAHVLLRCGWC